MLSIVLYCLFVVLIIMGIFCGWYDVRVWVVCVWLVRVILSVVSSGSSVDRFYIVMGCVMLFCSKKVSRSSMVRVVMIR